MGDKQSLHALAESWIRTTSCQIGRPLIRIVVLDRRQKNAADSSLRALGHGCRSANMRIECRFVSSGPDLER
jgi:hypothetical protein